MNRAPDCISCKAWDQFPDDPGRGICRRRPPQVELIVVAGDDGAEAMQTFAAYPTPRATGEGCFEHLPIEGIST